MKPNLMERFAYRVAALENLEPGVCAALAAHLRPDDIVRMILVAPRQNRIGKHGRLRFGLLPWILTPSWVLVVTARGLMVATLEQPLAEPLVTEIPTASLVWIEIGSVLLVGWLECAWVEDQLMRHLRVHFNTVGERHFLKVLRLLCCDLPEGSEQPVDVQDHNRSALKTLPFKYRGIIGSLLLLPGERVDAAVHQPAVWRVHHRLIRNQQAAATVLALTSKYLLVVHDEASFTERSIGFVARRYPLGRLIGVESERSGGEVALSLHAGIGDVTESYALQFEPASKGELVTLLAAWSPRGESGKRNEYSVDRVPQVSVVMPE